MKTRTEADPEVVCVETYLSEVLFKVTQLQALLQLQMVFAPELFKGVLRLIQLGQEPGTHHRHFITHTSRRLPYRYADVTAGPSPLHRGLVLQLVRVELVVFRLGRLLLDAAQQGGALLQRQLQLVLVHQTSPGKRPLITSVCVFSFNW